MKKKKGVFFFFTAHWLWNMNVIETCTARHKRDLSATQGWCDQLWSLLWGRTSSVNHLPCSLSGTCSTPLCSDHPTPRRVCLGGRCCGWPKLTGESAPWTGVCSRPALTDERTRRFVLNSRFSQVRRPPGVLTVLPLLYHTKEPDTQARVRRYDRYYLRNAKNKTASVPDCLPSFLLILQQSNNDSCCVKNAVFNS